MRILFILFNFMMRKNDENILRKLCQREWSKYSIIMKMMIKYWDESETEIHPKNDRTQYFMVVYLSIAKASITQKHTYTHTSRFSTQN